MRCPGMPGATPNFTKCDRTRGGCGTLDRRCIEPIFSVIVEPTLLSNSMIRRLGVGIAWQTQDRFDSRLPREKATFGVHPASTRRDHSCEESTPMTREEFDYARALHSQRIQ